MSGEFKLKSISSKHDGETLYIKQSTDSKKVVGQFNAFTYQDKETSQFIVYIPSLEISVYGETKEKAAKMLKFSIENFCEHITSISSKERDAELHKLGWRHHKVKNKEYSKSYVDVSGDLKNFALNGVVEQELLTT